MLTLDQLRVLRAVARHRSVAAAARSMHLSQPTLSHHLAALEALVDAPLVVRTPRGSHLTEIGELALAHAEVILDQVDAARAELAEHRAHGVSTLEVGAFPSVGAAVVAPALADLVAAGIPHRLTIAEPVDIDRMLADHELHAGVLYTSPDVALRPVDGIAVEPLFDDPLLVLLPPAHRLAGRRSVRLADLAGDTWIIGPSDDDPVDQLLLRAFSELGVSPRVGARLDDFAVTEALVLAGHGVSLIPQLALQQLGELVVPLPVADARFRRRIHMAWHERPHRPALATLLDGIRARAAPLRDG